MNQPTLHATASFSDLSGLSIIATTISVADHLKLLSLQGADTVATLSSILENKVTNKIPSLSKWILNMRNDRYSERENEF